MGTVNRRPYEGATALDQALLEESHDNLTIKLELIATIEEVGTGLEDINISDRAKYVDGVFYYPRTKFPTVTRTIGDWLAGTIEFSALELPINNSDGVYSHLLPGGLNYDGFIGKTVVVKAGIGEDPATYSIIFSGEITDVAGVGRDTSSFTVTARSDFERVNVQIPDQTLTEANFPDIEGDFLGLGAPIIYGDWTKELRSEAPEVPAFPVNGLDANVLAGTTDLRLVISSTPISVFDDTSVTLFRGDVYYTFAASDISIVGATNNTIFDIEQQNLLIDGSPWIYEPGDQFFLKVEGVALGIGYLGNLVEISRDILERFGGLTAGDFDASWSTIANKNSPPQDNVFGIEGRVWLQESTNAMEFVLSLLEQIRVECFVDRANKFHLSTLHFTDFIPAPSVVLRNHHVVRGTFVPEIDERNNFNRAQGDFSRSPVTGEAKFSTPVFRNDAAITQAAGRQISKLISFPNLIDIADVNNQVQEIIKMASCNAELISVDLTWFGQQIDISDEIDLSVDIGSVEFTNITEPVTGKVRDIGYTPEGRIQARLWSFQMVPFPGSLKAGVVGITGGSNAPITEET
jgi:hypothetical protein